MPGTTVFPAALDTGIDVDPNTPEGEAGKEHDVNHNDTWAAVLAVQAKVGIDGSEDAASIDARVAALEAGGGGGGAVDSVNGQTGAVVLDAGDVGAASAGDLAALDARVEALEEGGGGAPALYPRRDDITAVTGDVRFLLDKDPWQDRIDIFDDDGRLMRLASLTGSGRKRYLSAPAEGGEVYSVMYWSTDADVGATIMDAAAALAWTASYPDGRVGIAYDHTPTAASGGVSGYTYAVTRGALPAGLALDDSTGRIHGTPSTDQTADFDVTVSDSDTPPNTVTQTQGFEIAPGGHKYWRLFVTSNVGGGNDYLNVQEIEMRAAPGGADLCVGGTASADSVYPGSSANYCFDGDLGNGAGSGSYSSSTTTNPKWIMYEFPSSVSVAEVAIWPFNYPSLENARSIGSFEMQCSDNGVDWLPAGTHTGIASWVIGTPKTFAVGEIVDP